LILVIAVCGAVVGGISRSGTRSGLVDQIVPIGKVRGMKLIAEGVEERGEFEPPAAP